MASYRIVKVQPAYRITTEAVSPDGAGEAGRIVRIEPSYSIQNGEPPRRETVTAESAPPPPLAPVPPKVGLAAGDILTKQLLKNSGLADLVDSSPDALLVISTAGTILFANATCLPLLGYQPVELIGKPIEILVPAEVRRAHEAHRAGYKPDGSRRPMARLTNLTALSKDGRAIPVDVAVSPVGAEHANTLFVVAVRDATEHQAMMRDLEQLATTDPLTGLLNRRSFQAASLREFERFRRQGSALSLMLIDIDHFKTINDRFGHDLGDQALTQLASTCLSKLRLTDVMARLGGEEFVILIPGSKIDEAGLLAERLRISVSQMRTGREEVGFTVSIGLAEAHAGDRSIDEVLARADQALYRAKSEGRDRVMIAKNEPA